MDFKLSKKLFFISLLFLFFPFYSEAKSLYVNNSGSPACSDSTTYDNNDSAHPWCTIGRAAWGSISYESPNASQAAQSGDNVYVTEGMYTTGGNISGGRWDVALNPANSGTSDNPITFIGIGTVEIRMAEGFSGPLIGANIRNYIVWDNFYIDDYYSNSVSDTGPVVFHETTGSKLSNSRIKGYTRFIDNYNGIRIEATNGVIIENNEIWNIVGNTNETAIMMYDTQNAVISHNYIRECGEGIYVKGDHADDGWPQQNNTIRYNWIDTPTTSGINICAGNGSRIYQNVIKSTDQALRIQNCESPSSSNISIVNNTIVSTNVSGDYGIYYGGTSQISNLIFHNNIFYGSYYEVIGLGSASVGDQSFEHNVYYGFDTFGSVEGLQRNFSTWQGTYEQDSASPAGINQDPLFVDATYYKLQEESPALSLGVDVLDLDNDGSTTDNISAGAYITGNEVIGVETTSEDTTSPASPTGLSVN